MIQTYTPVRGMIICTLGGDFVKTADYLAKIAKRDEEIEELKKEMVRFSKEDMKKKLGWSYT